MHVTIHLSTAARIAREAACREVQQSMEAHGRFNPAWEVQEAGMHFAIRDGLLAHFRTLPPPRLRVGCEYGADAMTNVDFAPTHDSHPVDLAVLHPLVAADAPNGYSGTAWAAENSTVLGLIEVKKNWAYAVGDALWLNGVITKPTKPGMRALEWVMLAVFLAGGTLEAVSQLGEKTGKALAQSSSFRSLSQSCPIEAQGDSNSSGVRERWFDVMCYGMAHQ
jgi:hypothetical protein